MNPTTYWSDKSLPVDISCPPEVLAGLERARLDDPAAFNAVARQLWP